MNRVFSTTRVILSPESDTAADGEAVGAAVAGAPPTAPNGAIVEDDILLLSEEEVPEVDMIY